MVIRPMKKIVGLIEDGFENVIPVMDSKIEIDRFQALTKKDLTIGLRMAINEEPQSAYYTSRLGIRSAEIIDYYKQKIAKKKKVKLKMLHFFVDSGIKDTLYYWGEFRKALKIFADLKKICPTLDSINLGGGLPIRNNLAFEYDYKYMIEEVVRNIKEVCLEEGIEEPNIFTEFGKYTVGESGAIIFQVLEAKQQNDSELWYLIDNSLMNTIPDAWSIFEKFILLPINKWQEDYAQVNIGGISCDHSDYYNSEDLDQQIFLPKVGNEEEEPLYLGFFHTGAYQEAISGYGGIKHCLIPSPKHIIVDRDEKGNYRDWIYRGEQSVDDMLRILGYE
jgi:arginine decarboxylase